MRGMYHARAIKRTSMAGLICFAHGTTKLLSIYRLFLGSEVERHEITCSVSGNIDKMINGHVKYHVIKSYVNYNLPDGNLQSEYYYDSPQMKASRVISQHL